MSDEKIDHAALVGDVEAALGHYATHEHEHRLLSRVLAALEAAQQAPAVDVDRAVKIIAPWFQGSSERLARKAIDFLIASGILLDAAEVEARGLEKAADIADSIGHVNNNQHSHVAWEAAEAMRARAQQVREGNA